MLARVDRYLLREIGGPLLLGFSAYTFILLIQFIFQSAEMIIRRGVPASQVGELLLLTLPNIIVLTIPMSLLFGVLIAVGRLSADSEMTALRSSGVSLWRLLPPVLAVATALAVFNSGLMLYALPKGNSALQDLRVRIITSSASRQVEPRVFYEEWKGLMIYVFESDPGEAEWNGVFVARTLAGADNDVSVARSGQMRADPSNVDRLILEMDDVVNHMVDLNDADQYDTSHYQSVEQILEDPLATAVNIKRRTSKGLRELTVPELRERLAQPNLIPELRNLARVEIHKKFAIPAACIVFGILALPLGIQKVRAGRGTGFSLSLGVLIVHYVLMSNGEEAARYGRVPAWFAMWLPNILMATLGLVLLLRKNDDLPLLPRPIDFWFRSKVVPAVRRLLAALRRKPASSPASIERPAQARSLSPDRDRAQFVLQLPRFALRFPNRMDRYVIRIFAWVFLLVLVSGMVLFSLSDFTERIDEILDNNVPLSTVLAYHKFASLQIGFDVGPIAVLVTTLVIFGMLARTNEITAAKALGISLYRLAIPALLAALVVTAVAAWMQERVLPAANQRAAQLDSEMHGNDSVRSYRRGDRNWIFGQDRYIYNYLNYDSERKELHRLQVFEFDDEHRLIRRLFAKRARYVGDGWLFEDTWTRSFDGLETTEFRRFDQPALGQFPETPAFFESEVKAPDALSYAELKDYIGELEASGQSVPDLWTRLHYKVSYPATFFVMGLVALPFAFRMGKRGALFGIGLGLVLGMLFLATVAFSSTLGETGALPARLSVWAPALAFTLLSFYAFLGVET